MVQGELTRKLAAILAADVAGYSRLMGENERATIATLNEFRPVFRAHIKANQGRVFNMAGDSVLAVFESVVGAVQAALEAQGELAKLNDRLYRTCLPSGTGDSPVPSRLRRCSRSQPYGG